MRMKNKYENYFQEVRAKNSKGFSLTKDYMSAEHRALLDKVAAEQERERRIANRRIELHKIKNGKDYEFQVIKGRPKYCRIRCSNMVWPLRVTLYQIMGEFEFYVSWKYRDPCRDRNNVFLVGYQGVDDFRIQLPNNVYPGDFVYLSFWATTGMALVEFSTRFCGKINRTKKRFKKRFRPQIRKKETPTPPNFLNEQIAKNVFEFTQMKDGVVEGSDYEGMEL